MRSIYRITRRNRDIFHFLLPRPPPHHLLAHCIFSFGETTICRRRPREYRLMAYERVNEKLQREWRPLGIQARNSPPSSLNPAGFRWIIRAVLRITSLYPWHHGIRLCAPRIFAFYTVLPRGADRGKGSHHPGWRTGMKAIDIERYRALLHVQSVPASAWFSTTNFLINFQLIFFFNKTLKYPRFLD